MKRKSILTEQLLRKYIEGTCSPKEKTLVERWYNKLQEQATPIQSSVLDKNSALIKERLRVAIEQNMAPRRFSWRQYAVAALVLVLISVTYTYLYLNPTNKQGIVLQALEQEKAYMITTSGDSINLAEIQPGEQIALIGIQIEKAATGELRYALPKNATAQTFKVVTPLGGQFRFTFPDGTSVHLNAGSSLTFTSNFGYKDRVVDLNGEAYFEVAKRKNNKGDKIPFSVKSKGQIITVLGTHFNVSAYDADRYTNTTLLEGSVKIESLKGDKNVLRLKPGEKSKVNNANGAILKEVNNKNTTVDWTAGYYKLSDEKLSALLTKISRWYNVRIEIAPDVQDIRLGGRISRKEDLQKAMEILEATGNIKIELRSDSLGQKLIVKPKL